ncbi:hypothetical protein [Reichenbachiella sp.]|uniref:hypothetical protein n=1 Tax=Reichenbachiella sp. TaxID=2184521 RepID=UPI003B5AAEBF
MRSLLILALLLPFALFGQNATVNFHNTTYDFDSKSKYSMIESYSITIHNKNGNKFAVFHDYMDKFRKLSSFKMNLLDGNGNKVKKYGRYDIVEYSFDASYEIDDTKSLYLKPEYALYPYTIEVEVEWNVNGILGLRTWMPQSSFDQAVSEANLEIRTPSSVQLKTLEQQISGGTVEVGETVIHKWEVSNLMAVSSKNNDYQKFYKNQPKIYLALKDFQIDGSEGSTESWQSFGQWMFDLNRGTNELLPETMEYLAGIDRSNRKEVIRQVYQYMQDRTRYVSIQLGIGGWKTLPSEEVDENGFGDCKALTYYTMAMLNYMGIPSNGVLVRAGRDVPEINIDFPSNQFNHIFLGIPNENDTIYLECTSQTQPFDYLGSFTDDRYVLWIEDHNSKIIRSPVYNQKLNFKESKAILTLEDDGNAILKVKSLNKGLFSDEHRIFANLGEKKYEQVATKNFDYSDFVISNYDIEPLDRNNPKYYSNFILNINGFAKEIDENLMVPSNVLNSVEHYVSYSRYNKYAEIKRAFRIKDDVDIIPPKGTFIETLPPSQKLDTQYGTYELIIERIDDKIHVVREFEFYKREYSNEEFDKFFKYLRRVSRIEKKYLVLNNKT